MSRLFPSFFPFAKFLGHPSGGERPQPLNDRNRGGEQGKQRTACRVTCGPMPADGKS